MSTTCSIYAYVYRGFIFIGTLLSATSCLKAAIFAFSFAAKLSMRDCFLSVYNDWILDAPPRLRLVSLTATFLKEPTEAVVDAIDCFAFC